MTSLLAAAGGSAASGAASSSFLSGLLGTPNDWTHPENLEQGGSSKALLRPNIPTPMESSNTPDLLSLLGFLQ